MVTHPKLPGIGALALLSAALVLALAGGVEPLSGPTRDLTAGTLGLSVFSSIPDDAQIGSDRTVPQVSARRAGAGGTAAVANASRFAPLLGAVTLLLLAVGMRPVPQVSRPPLRGPPPA